MNDLEGLREAAERSRQEKAALLRRAEVWRMVCWLAAVAVLFIIWLSNPINETRMRARWKEIQAVVRLSVRLESSGIGRVTYDSREVA
jgi:hypothetical protein